MSHNVYIPLNKLQCNLCTCFQVVHYCKNANFLRQKSQHICTSAIYYQVDLVMKTLCCRAKCAVNIKLFPTLLAAGNLILLSNLPKPWTLVCALELYHFHSNIHNIQSYYRTQFHKCSFSAGSYYLAQAMLSCHNNAAVMDNLFRTFFVLNKMFFDYLRACGQILS